jgi:hypothetical protein
MMKAEGAFLGLAGTEIEVGATIITVMRSGFTEEEEEDEEDLIRIVGIPVMMEIVLEIPAQQLMAVVRNQA